MGDPKRGAIVEVNDGKMWGRICVEGWTISHGAFVCKQHGYEGAIATVSRPFDASTSEEKEVLINLDPVCAGNLNSVECRRDISATCECKNVAAGIVCCKYYQTLF